MLCRRIPSGNLCVLSISHHRCLFPSTFTEAYNPFSPAPSTSKTFSSSPLCSNPVITITPLIILTQKSPSPQTTGARLTPSVSSPKPNTTTCYKLTNNDASQRLIQVPAPELTTPVYLTTHGRCSRKHVKFLDTSPSQPPLTRARGQR